MKGYLSYYILLFLEGISITYLYSKYSLIQKHTRSMAFVHENMHFLLLFTFSTFSFSSISINSLAKPQRLVSKLIHRRSVLHPLYNPNETTKDHMENDIEHSIARLAYLQARIDGTLAYDDHRSKLFPSSTGRTILANISIGQPPIPQLVIVDTASDIFWIMCNPCSNCDNHIGQLFDPSKSSSFSPLCKTPCNYGRCECSLNDQLTYRITYADQSAASGTIGLDMLVFETSDEGTIQVPNIEFGCSHDIVYNKDPGYNGILSLNNAPHSLASQIGQKFSYCIGSITDKNYNYNQLVLGEGAYLEGDFTSFQPLYDNYYLSMEGISIGEKRLDIVPESFEMKANGSGGVIIDTGCTLTYLVDDVYNLLYDEVRNLIGSSSTEIRFEKVPWMLCYAGSISRDLVGFPVVTFHFAEGAELALDTGSFFQQAGDNIFCMTIAPISVAGITSKPSVIGLLAQQSYNVGYDLIDQFIYFQRIDCELLSA
ncbi:PREDICTED: aspartic proteinase CDR1-like [Lupinus angustifolius]|nr:PREDICTED: aspartic proteinase CDR1-like [Lupinus angustifolius]